MINLNFLATSATHKMIGVLGLARTGLSVCRALQAAGMPYIAWDDHEAERAQALAEGVHVAPLVGKLRATDCQALIISPGIPHTWPTPHPLAWEAKQWGVPLICDIDLLFLARQFSAECALPRMVGVTGTNGKSTTVALIQHLLAHGGAKAIAAGNNGVPVLTLPDLAFDAIVLELSSYQLELTPSLNLDLAVLLNISSDHLARHGGMAGYIAAKQRILSGVAASKVGFIGCDDDACQTLYRDLMPVAGDRLIPISTEREVVGGIFVQGDVIIDDAFGDRIALGCLGSLQTLRGRHNWQNALAAYGAARWYGLKAEVILEGLASFPGLAHRQEYVTATKKAVFINDSKATNADSSTHALDAYEGILWIVGGRPKEGGIESLGEHFKRVRHAFVIGEAQKSFATTLRQNKIPFELCGDLENAMAAIQEYLDKVSDCEKLTVLLSPACASWDQYPDFEARGEHFRRLALEYCQAQTSPKEVP